MTWLGLGLSLNAKTRGVVPTYDAAAAAVFAAMTSNPGGVRKSLINTYIVALKAANVWTSLDVLYLLAAHDVQAARINWKNPGTFTLTDVTAQPAFVANQGFTSNGTTSHLDTNYTPSTQGVAYVQDAASLWMWSRTDITENSQDIGTATAPTAFIAPRFGVNINGRLNDATSVAVANPDTLGMFGISRADANVRKFWKNGVQLGTDSAAVSTGVPATTQRICRANGGTYSTKQLAMAAWGDSLATKELAFYNATLAYLQGVGAA